MNGDAGAMSRALRLATASPAWLRATVLALAAIAVAVILALANVAWFELLNGWLGLTEPLPRALLFSSFLLIVGGLVVVREPAAYGLRIGSIRRHWRLVTGAIVTGAILPSLALRIGGSTPYAGASWVVEVVVVPFTEELVFRAVLLTALISATRRLGFGPNAVLLAVAIDAVAFGVAHATNALSLAVAFVTLQVLFATLVGLGCAGLMARTKSVYPAMALHAVVNAVVVAM